MTLQKAFFYTISFFTLLCLLSYAAFSQAQPLSMKQALDLTMSNNRQIKISTLEVDRSEQQIAAAKGQSLPEAGLNGQLIHYFEVPAFFGFDNSGGDKIPYGRFGGRDQGTAGVYVSQPVYKAGNKPALRYARLMKHSGDLSLTDRRSTVTALLKQTYIQILVLQERIKLQQQSLERNEKALQDARSLLAQGRALRVDTLRAYTTVRNLEPDLLRLTYAVNVGKQQLKTLMGIDTLKDIQLTDSLELPGDEAVLSENEVYDQARQNRADLKVTELEQQLSDEKIRLAAAPMKPSLSVNAQYLLQTQTNKFDYTNAYYPSTPFVGAQVNIPIFSGNINRSKVKQAEIEKQQAIQKSKNAYEELRAEVKQVVADVRETRERIQIREQVRETALLSYDITQYRYAKGVASRLELTDAELALTTAQSDYLGAVYDYLSARISLDRTMGK